MDATIHIGVGQDIGSFRALGLTAWLAAGTAVALPPDADRFLSFHNNVAPAHAENETTARAYYRAVDPAGERASLSAFKAVNGFAAATDRRNARYLNDVDLGFGRSMTVWTAPNGDLAAFVENFADDSPGATTAQAIDGDLQENIANAVSGRNLLATVAMEFGPPVADPAGAPYTRFYVFGPDGRRLTHIDLDGRGAKAVPGACNVCHGGNPRPLDDNGDYPAHGDTSAYFLPWDLDTFMFSPEAPYREQDQREVFRDLNEMILRTVPVPGASLEAVTTGWALRELVSGWYGDANPRDNVLPALAALPDRGFYGGYVPLGWVADPAGYLQAVAPNCRTCHITRNPAVDLNRIEEAAILGGRIRWLVYHQGVMPLAERTFRGFWSTTEPGSAAARLAAMAPGGIDLAAQQPGGAAESYAGPDRFAPLGSATTLDGRDSLFAYDRSASFGWSLVSKPSGSTSRLSRIEGPTVTLTPDVAGEYVVRLTASNAHGSAAAHEVTVRATTTGLPGADDVRFLPDVEGIIQARCMACHRASARRAPPFDDHRLGESTAEAIYRNLVQRVNVRSPESSLLMLKGRGNLEHDGGGLLLTLPDESNRLETWIRTGAARTHRPAHDDLERALILTGDSGTVTASNRFATRQADEARHADDGGHSIWWSFRAEESGELTVSTAGSDFDNTLALYAGVADHTRLTPLGAAHGNAGTRHSRLVVPVVGGQTIFIAVDGFNSGASPVQAASGQARLGWTFERLSSAEVPRSLALLDVDQDGHRDIVTEDHFNGALAILAGNGDGTFEPVQRVSVPGDPAFVVMTDLDRDGLVDAVAALEPGGNRLAVLLQRPDHGWHAPVPITIAGTSPEHLAVADLNADGVPDLVTANAQSNDVTALLGNGDGSFTAGPTLALGAAPGSLALADLDGDGLADAEEALVLGSSPILVDSDNDGLDDPDEVALGTGLLDADSDDDGLSDGAEMATQWAAHRVPDAGLVR